MKILFYSHTGQVSGAENILLLALKYLNRQRFTPLALCPASGGLAEKIREMGIPCRTVEDLEARFTWRIDLFIRYLLSFYRTIRDLRNEILRDGPDLIHANSIRAGLVATAATFGTNTPVFWHLQDELKRHPFSTAIRLFVALSKRTRLIAASQATADSFRGKLLKRFGKSTPLRVIHNAIEMDRFRPDPADRPRMRKELGLSDGEFVMGVIGQITPRKGQLELIRTFAGTREKMPPSTLLVVGAPMFNRDHEYLEQIKDTVRESGLAERVRLLGLRNDVPALMQALDVLVVNSKSEALVVVAIEAMACGTPVIATDAGGTREMIEDRVNGFVVPFGDEERLSKALIELGHDENLRRTFAAEGKKVVTERLNAGKFIADMEGFFAGAAAPEKPKSELLLQEN